MNDLKRARLTDTRSIARDQVERIFEERLTALSAGVVEAVAESLAGARRELAGKLNQSVRRLRSAEGEEQWSKAMLDATQGFADRAALFTLQGKILHLQASRNMAGEISDFGLDAAPAFASAVQTKDTVVALRVRSEMSGPVADWGGEDQARKFCLVPIITKGRVFALLYADSAGNVDANGLELLATVGGAVKEGRDLNTGAPATLVNIAPPATPEDQDLHFKAQRFARNQVAEIRLYQSEKVKNGRTGRNLYASLKEEIDAARAGFRQDFLPAPGMTDYLHLELVRTLANNDVELLGPEYPGPLA